MSEAKMAEFMNRALNGEECPEDGCYRPVTFQRYGSPPLMVPSLICEAGHVVERIEKEES